jgi:hypothetical protein
VRKIVNDALAYNAKHPAFGFADDSGHAPGGAYYGPLINLSNY